MHAQVSFIVSSAPLVWFVEFGVEQRCLARGFALGCCRYACHKCIYFLVPRHLLAVSSEVDLSRTATARIDQSIEATGTDSA